MGSVLPWFRHKVTPPKVVFRSGTDSASAWEGYRLPPRAQIAGCRQPHPRAGVSPLSPVRPGVFTVASPRLQHPSGAEISVLRKKRDTGAWEVRKLRSSAPANMRERPVVAMPLGVVFLKFIKGHIHGLCIFTVRSLCLHFLKFIL